MAESIRTESRKSEDASEGRTIFIRNLNFDTTEEELKEYFEDYGTLEYAKVVKDRVTERSRGTGFVKFVEKSTADEVLLKSESDPDEFELNGRVLNLVMALIKKELPAPAYSKENTEKKRGSRNLHLARVGMITPGSKEADTLSKSDLEKRTRMDKTRIEKLKDPSTFISPLRICIRNIPVNLEDKELKKICKNAGGVDCNVVECRIMRDLNRVSGKGIAKSRGFAFVAFDEHAHALKALQFLNNNPDIFGNDRRPIVEFSIENRAALEKKARRLELSKKRALETEIDRQNEENDVPKKKRKKFNFMQAQLEEAPNKMKLSSKLPTIGGKKKKNRHRDQKSKVQSKKPKGKISRKEKRKKKHKT